MTQGKKFVLRERNTTAAEKQQLLERQSRRAYLRRIRKREYKRLRTMIPAVAEKPHASKVTVIEEAINYIDELHSALAQRIQETCGITCPEETKRHIEAMVQQFMPLQCMTSHLPVPVQSPLTSQVTCSANSQSHTELLPIRKS